ncbi:hypothetical protein FRC03_005350 [Tulasnella sp. 419]|nr:hypothetical protein FRC03_005350 [Tulasnella sp. 419]
MQTSNADNFFRAESALADEEARKLKAIRTKDVGNPIDLGSKINHIVVRDNEAWTAESGRIVRRVDLETGATKQTFKGHGGPVTYLALFEIETGENTSEVLLITGGWDKTIRIWNTTTNSIISETVAHDDFVKCLLIIPSSRILVSSSSDKTVKLWDLSDITLPQSSGKPLHQLASISRHTRPVEALSYMDGNPLTLFTGDSMGVISVWNLDERWSATEHSLPTIKVIHKQDLEGHRTGVNDLWTGRGYLVTASTDNNTLVRRYPDATSTGGAASALNMIEHSYPVKRVLPLSLLPEASLRGILITASGDILRTYDVSEMILTDDEDDSPDEPARPKREAGTPKAYLLSEVDAHYFPISALALWSKARREYYIVSASLDGTLRRWKLSELIEDKIIVPDEAIESADERASVGKDAIALTEDEERELAELMNEY